MLLGRGLFEGGQSLTADAEVENARVGLQLTVKAPGVVDLRDQASLQITRPLAQRQWCVWIELGMLAHPPSAPKPKRGETGYDFGAITNGYPLAFTNPFILDLNGDGAFTAPGAKGAGQ